MKGLSSTALAKATSLAQPRPSRSAVSRAVSVMISPISFTASILMPARVLATFTDAHTRSVRESASGMERMRRRSLRVAPFWTSAE